MNHTRAARWILALGLGLGCWSNVRFALAHGDSLAVYNLGIDTETYDRLARDVARTGNLDAIPPDQPPGFIVLLGLVYRLSGGSRVAAKLLSCVLITLTAVLMWWTGRRCCGEAVGTLSGVLVANSGMLRTYAATLQYEVLAAFLLALVTTLTLWCGSSTNAKWTHVACGAAGLSALAALTRETLIVAFPVLLCFVAVRRQELSWRARSVVLGAMTLTFVLLVALWVIRQSVVAGHLVPISDKGSVNLRIGNNPNANGTYNLMATDIGEPSGWAFMAARRRATLRLAWRKALYFCGVMKDGWNIPRWVAIYASRATLNLLPLDWWLVLARGGGLACLATLGLVFLLRTPGQWTNLWPVPITVLAVMTLHIVTMSSHRFAVPVLPHLYFLAAIPLTLTAKRIIASAAYPFCFAVAIVGVCWSLFAQTLQIPGIYRRQAVELDGTHIVNAIDPASPAKTVRYADATQGARIMALETDEFFPRGFMIIVLRMRSDPPGPPSTPLGDVAVTDTSGRALCTAQITGAHFPSSGYQRIPARCEVPDDQVLRIIVQTRAKTNLWLDDFAVRFGYSTREEAVLPDIPE